MLSAQRLVVCLSVGLSVGAVLTAGCGSSGSSSGSGGGTATGGATSSGGATGSGGATVAFMAVNPCKTADAYTTTGNTVTFGGDGMYTYEPSCLKVAVGTAVTFKGGVTGGATQTFNDHPLNPSSSRGTTTGSPITATMSADTSKSFTFTKPGFFAYNCLYHGSDSTTGDTYMSGVIWVE